MSLKMSVPLWKQARERSEVPFPEKYVLHEEGTNSNDRGGNLVLENQLKFKSLHIC